MSVNFNGKIYTSDTKNRNDYWTPRWSVEEIIKVIPDNVKTIWECCCGEYWISKVLEEHGYNVIKTDIRYNEKHDVLNYEPDEEYDLILTNPPYNIKNDVIKRCYDLNKPWLLLMPLGTLESQKRIKMFQENGVTYFQHKKRVNFYSTYNKKTSGSPFYSIWFGHNIEGYNHNAFYYLDK